MKWYNADSKGGLFLHWGMGTGLLPGNLPYKTVEEFEAATAISNWSAQHMVDAAVKLNCKYIIWATLHGEHGLVRTWKSNIPGTPVTKRDYLGELVNAAAKENIKVIVYVPGDIPMLKPFTKAFVDSAAYAKYKNVKVDIKNSVEEWVLYFAKDVIMELMDRYPAVAGVWTDGWNHPKVDTVVFDAIHKKRNDFLIFRNEYANKPTYEDQDVMGIEPFAKVLNPPYDKASGMYVEAGNGIEASYLLGSEWWYTGDNNAANAKWAIKMTASSLGGNGLPCFAIGPTISGEAVPKVKAVVDSIKQFFDYASTATNNVWGGGYKNGGFRSGTLNNSAYMATTLLKDGNTHFIHVLNKPNTNYLVIPMLGYKIKNVSLLATGKTLPYRIKGNNLFVENNNWSNYERSGVEIIQINTEGKPGLVTKNNWVATTNSEDATHPVSFAIDDSQDTWYASNAGAAMPVELTINLSKRNSIAGININQYEARALTEAYYHQQYQGTRAKDYEVYSSRNGKKWALSKKGTFLNERGVKDIQFDKKQRRVKFIKLKILNNYKGDGVVQISNIEMFEN